MSINFKGCGATTLSTTDDEGLGFSDNTWYHLVAWRLGGRARIIVNSRWTGEATFRVACVFVHVQASVGNFCQSFCTLI